MFGVWCNQTWDPGERATLESALRGQPLECVAPADTGLGVAAEKAEVLVGQPPLALLERSRAVRWVHLTSAGYGRYADRHEWFTQRGVTLTKSSEVYANPCAQHVFAFMMAHSRQLPLAWSRHREHRWSYSELRPRAQILDGQRVVIVGYGRIGERLAELLAPFHMRVSGLRRRVDTAAAGPLFALGSDAGDAELATADHVVNLLPGTDETALFFNRKRLESLRPGAVFYNVGRGTTVDQAVLAERLHNGQLGAAWLDVTDPEPLPPDAALWSAPNCIITPHMAGGRQAEGRALFQHFLDNLERYRANRELVDQVRWPVHA
jgi:phosphoglycerate dehydrogenase-like enzyme